MHRTRAHACEQYAKRMTDNFVRESDEWGQQNTGESRCASDGGKAPPPESERGY